MTIKVVIRRKISNESWQNANKILLELRERANNRDGYISGETLRNFDDPEDFLVIAEWRSLDDWKMWEASPTRRELQGTLDIMLDEKTEYGVYHYV